MRLAVDPVVPGPAATAFADAVTVIGAVFAAACVTLNPGDVAYFDGRGVHRYRNVANGEAKAFSVTWPAIF